MAINASRLSTSPLAWLVLACGCASPASGSSAAAPAASPTAAPAASPQAGATAPAEAPAAGATTAPAGSPPTGATGGPSKEPAKPAGALSKDELEALYEGYAKNFAAKLKGEAPEDALSSSVDQLLEKLGFSASERAKLKPGFNVAPPELPTSCNLDPDAEEERIARVTAFEPGSEGNGMAPPAPSAGVMFVAWLDPTGKGLQVVGRRVYEGSGVDGPKFEVACKTAHDARFADSVVTITEVEIAYGATGRPTTLLELVSTENGKLETLFAAPVASFSLKGGAPRQLEYIADGASSKTATWQASERKYR